MIIRASSNLVTALYCVTSDLLLPIVLSTLARALLSFQNIKLIYCDGKEVHLTSTRLALCSHQGLAEKRASRAIAIIVTLATLMAMVGGFSITGFSMKQRIIETVPVLVGTGSPENYTDITKHVSMDGRFVSGTFLLTYNALFCRAKSPEDVWVYSSFNDLKDLDSVKWPWPASILANATCLMKESQFEEIVAKKYKVKDLEDIGDCSINVKWNASGRLTNDVNLIVTGNCNVVFHEDVWCAAFENAYCIGLVESAYGFGTLVMRFEEIGTQLKNGTFHRDNIYPFFSKERIDSTVLRSTAYLKAANVFPQGTTIEQEISALTVRQNAEVIRLGEDIESTEIHLLSFSLTFGTALLLTVGLAVAAVVSWRMNIVRTGLLECNRLYSPQDMLLFAATHMEASSDISSDISSDAKSKRKNVMFGVSRKVPHVGPLTESDDEGHFVFEEKELEGNEMRSRQRASVSGFDQEGSMILSISRKGGNKVLAQQPQIH